MTSTTRLGLYKPDGTELCSPVTSMYDQYDIIDDKATTTIISLTEPTPDFIGKEWWKPDTKEFFIWSGTIWVQVDLIPDSGPPPGPAGRKGFTVASNVTEFGTISSGESINPFLPTTFAAEIDKKYEITYCGSVTCQTALDAPAYAAITLRIASGSSVTNSASLIHKIPSGRRGLTGFTSFAKHGSLKCIWTAPSTGNYTVGVFLRTLNNTVSFQANVYHALAVESV